MRRAFPAVVLLAMLVGGFLAATPRATAAPIVAFYPQTGHTLELGFRRFVVAHGGTALFGYPLTEEIVEQGRLVQYFQHLRLEWHPEAPSGQQVVISPLGLDLHKSQPAPAAKPGAPAGHTLVDGFKRFYDTNDGTALLGPPITEELSEDGRVVQYFANGELQWQPAAGVTFADLGVTAAKAQGWAPDKPPLAPVPAPPGAQMGDAVSPPLTGASVNAAAEAITLPGARASIALPVLMYHHIGSWPSPYSVSAANFAAQLAWLQANGYQAVTLRQVVAAFSGPVALPAKPVAISIDDGYDDAATTARDLLKQFHMTATFFIPTWQTRLSAVTLRAMDKEGFDIEAHSRTHPDLTTLSDAAAWSEIKGSKDDLERILGHSVDLFAYPYGAENARIVALVEKAGYRAGILAADVSRSYAASTAYREPRILVDRGDDLANFTAKVLSRRYRDTLGGGGPQPSLPATSRQTGDGDLPSAPAQSGYTGGNGGATGGGSSGAAAGSSSGGSVDSGTDGSDSGSSGATDSGGASASGDGSGDGSSAAPPSDGDGNTTDDGSGDSSNPGGHGAQYN